MAVNVETDIEVFDAMVPERSTIDNKWQEIRDTMQPDDASFIGENTPGSTNRSGNLDSTAENAGEITGSAFHNSLSNPSTRWYDIAGIVGQENLDDDERLWLMDATSDSLSMFESGDSNFSDSQQIKYRNTIFYGMAATFMEEKFGVGVFFHSIPLREIYVNEGSDGQVNEVWRPFELTAAQAVEKFKRPGDKPGELVVKAADDATKRQEKTRFLHITRPRLSIPDGIGPLTMPFESVYINVDEKTLVRESGFPEWPWSVPRLRKRAGEKYGRGRGHVVLPDVRMANRIVGATIESLEKNVDPSLQLPDDGVMGIPSLARGGLTYVRSDLFRHGDPIRKIHAGGETNMGIDYTIRLDKKIEDGFWNNLLSISDDPRMSATQVITLDEKSQNILGPVIGSFEVSDLDPMVNRVLGIGIRSGRVRPPPESLSEKPLKIIYTSPLARRRRSGEVAAIGRTFELVVPMAQINPKVWDNFDFDETTRIIASVEGLPPGVLKPLDEVLKKRATDDAAAAQSQNLEDAATIAQAAGAAAPALEVIQGGQSEAS
ncbi:MAG: portal protein [Nitrospinaceae bacterium]